MMREIANGIFLEDQYPGVQLGAVLGEQQILLIDSTLRGDDAKSWLADLSEQGVPRYLFLLDHHPDRLLGARAHDLPLVSQEETRRVISELPDTYKGSVRAIGAEADRLKRVTGLSNSVPEVAFAETATIHLDHRKILLTHAPGPTLGSAWVEIPDAETIFVGDLIFTSEPPFVGYADLESWMGSLDRIRDESYKTYTVIASREGLVDRQAANASARFLRKIPHRLESLANDSQSPEAAGDLAEQLISDFKLAVDRRDLCLLRLQVGLERLYARLYPDLA
jgi:glyoxylase-like metal-dependent hydrolase (beta-lactamase superfamily II)